MKILVGIPVVNGYGHTKDAIESVLNQEGVDLLLIDNGAEPDIKELFKTYSDNPRVHVIVNPTNRYVNPAWNQIIKHFLSSIGHDLLVIMNSDLVLQHQWSKVLFSRYLVARNESYLPTVIEDKEKINQTVGLESVCQEIQGGAPGIFITLTKEQAKLVYPVTEECLVWFGDNWIYETLRSLGHKTIILNNLLAHHSPSQTISRIPEVGNIITFDQKLWPEVQRKMNERNKGKQPSV